MAESETNDPPRPQPPSDEATQPQAQDDVQPNDILQNELDDLRQQLLRSAADYQNLARRSQQNLEDTRQQAIFDLAKSLAVVIDHFDRALAVDLENTSAASVLDGLQLVRAELLKTLNQAGIERIDARVGDEFDPRLHQALLQQEIEGLPSQRVAVQFEPGYRCGERVVRPAKVSVTP